MVWLTGALVVVHEETDFNAEKLFQACWSAVQLASFRTHLFYESFGKLKIPGKYLDAVLPSLCVPIADIIFSTQGYTAPLQLLFSVSAWYASLFLLDDIDGDDTRSERYKVS